MDYILLLELILSIAHWQILLDLFDYRSFLSLALLSLIFLQVSAVLSLLKPLFTERKNLNAQVEKLKKIKFNAKVFNFLFNENVTIDTQILPATTIQFGNPKGQHVLTLVTNPICNSCAEMHRDLFYLLRINNNIKVEEIFLTSKSDQAVSKRAAKAMIQIFQRFTPEKFQHLLEEFYENTLAGVEAWIQKYSTPQDQASFQGKSDPVLQHLEWCKIHGVFSTPRIYLNGKSLPVGYDLRDLEYLIN